MSMTPLQADALGIALGLEPSMPAGMSFFVLLYQDGESAVHSTLPPKVAVRLLRSLADQIEGDNP